MLYTGAWDTGDWSGSHAEARPIPGSIPILQSSQDGQTSHQPSNQRHRDDWLIRTGTHVTAGQYFYSGRLANHINILYYVANLEGKNYYKL